MNYSLKQMLLHAKQESYAVGAFNIFNHISAKAVIKAAEELGSPLILQTSVSTVRKIGVNELINMLNGLKENAAVPVIIHLDHCTDIKLARECADAGWDSVMIDASNKPLNENIAITLEAKLYAEKRNVCVEGELGIIKGIEDDIESEAEEKTNYQDALKYLNSTGIDAFAPAIGTAHGLYTKKAVLNFELVRKLSTTTECPVVIHGGTGLAPEDFKRLIECGATKINISTAIKHAYFDAYKNYFELNPDDRNPLKLDEYVEAFIKDAAKRHIILFGSAGRVNKEKGNL